jgi:hypothetical protein
MSQKQQMQQHGIIASKADTQGTPANPRKPSTIKKTKLKPPSKQHTKPNGATYRNG